MYLKKLQVLISTGTKILISNVVYFSQDRLIFSSSESEITRAGGYRACGRTDSAEIRKLDVTVTGLPSQTCLQHVDPVIILKSFPVPEYSTVLHLTEVR